MRRLASTFTILSLVIAVGLSGLASPAYAQRGVSEIHPDTLTAEQKELLNFCYLPLRLDLLPAINATGDQVVVVREARMRIIYILSLQRTREDEAIIQSRRATSPAMVKFILEHAARVRDALSEEQRRAFTKLLADKKLAPITVDASTRHFLLRYTFGPNDRVEKAKAPDGRILDVVVPEQEDIKQWHTELKTGAELLKVLENNEGLIRKQAIDWLIERGSASLDAATKKTIAETILTQVEKGENIVDPGLWMRAYSAVGQPAHVQRVWAVVEKCGIHHVAGMVAAYAAVAPAKAVAYAAKPTPDKHFSIRAVQGLAMAPDAPRLLTMARAKMPDMAWKIDDELKNIRAREAARAAGLPENPGLVELEARRQAEKAAAEKAREGKKPGDYQGYDDWFADLSSGDKMRIDKAAAHFVNSVYAVDLAAVTPQQRAAVFAIAHKALTTKGRSVPDEQAGQILIASASAENTDTLLAMITPDNGRAHFPLAALIRVNPNKAEQVILGIIEGRPKFRISPIPKAGMLAPAEAIAVLEKVRTKVKIPGVRDFLGQIIDSAQQQAKQRTR